MRQVIRRFLNHLETEKNASLTTIKSYRYDLHKFDDYLVKRLGNRFLPGDVTRDHIRDYLLWLSEVGHQRPNGPSARARELRGAMEKLDERTTFSADYRGVTVCGILRGRCPNAMKRGLLGGSLRAVTDGADQGGPDQSCCTLGWI